MMSGFVVVFAIVSILVVAVFAAVVVAIFRSGRLSAANRAAPEVSAAASVIDKRIETSGGGDTRVSQTHFVTFEQASGERFELQVPATEYGLLAVGDRGAVAMKGTRYLGFTREILR